MAVTEILSTDHRITFSPQAGGSGFGGSTTGTWVWQNDNTGGGTAGAVNLASGAGVMRSNNSGDYLTCTLPANTRAVYMLGVGKHSSCDLDVQLSTDGGAYIDYGRISTMVATTSAGAELYRYPRALLRGLSASHTYTLKLIVISGQSSVSIDSLIAVTGSKITPISGKYSALGDSWTAGVGATASNVNGYAYQLSQMLRTGTPVTKMPNGWTFANHGVSGDALWGLGNVGSGKLGGFYRLWSQVCFDGSGNANVGEWLTILYGPNDLGQNGVGAGDHGRNLYTTLCLYEDIVDTNKLTNPVLVGTPGYVSPLQHMQYQQGMDLSSVFWRDNLSSNYETAVDVIYEACSPFGWVTSVQVYEGMDERSGLVWPNSSLGYNGDWGLHPNDDGHMRIAMIFLGAARGILQSPFAQGGRVLAAR